MTRPRKDHSQTLEEFIKQDKLYGKTLRMNNCYGLVQGLREIKYTVFRLEGYPNIKVSLWIVTNLVSEDNVMKCS